MEPVVVGALVGSTVVAVASFVQNTLSRRSERRRERDWRLREVYADWHGAHFVAYRAVNHALNVAAQGVRNVDEFNRAQDEREESRRTLERATALVELFEVDHTRRAKVRSVTDMLPIAAQAGDEDWRNLVESGKGRDEIMKAVASAKRLVP